MIVLDLTLSNILGFSDFHMNFSYPKKIVHSIIEDEHLKDRPSFRYKKAVLLMGANATGKTSLGRALAAIFKFINTGNTASLLDLVARDAVGAFTIDFVNDGFVLHRLTAAIDSKAAAVSLGYDAVSIGERDSYEKCAKRFPEKPEALAADVRQLKKRMGTLKYRFAYPAIETTLNVAGMNKAILLRCLRAVIGTLDPTLTDVSASKDLRDSYIIRRKGTDIIIQDGKLLNREVLSGGTAEGIDIAIFLASIMSGVGSFYYCDEHFCYIAGDIEKRIFGLMLDHLNANEQLIFTTHNSDMLDLNLPKHSFAFLRKGVNADGDCTVTVTFASDLLKRNTDSIRCAFENDVFSSLPNEALLDQLEKGWTNG